MSQTLSLSNFDSPNIKEKTQLDADVAVGATTLTVHFSDDLENGDFIYLSRLGSETGEIVTVDTVTDADTITITSAATKPHSRFDDITCLFGDQMKVYRASNSDGTQPDDSDFGFLDTVNIDYDQLSTTYVDSGGSSSYWYKFIYRNSSSGEESELGDSKAVRGGGVGQYASIESIRVEAGLHNNRYISDALVDEKRQAAQAEINSELSGIYALPFTVPVPALISEITRKIAAGLLLIQDYGVVNTLSTNNGQALLTEGRDKLTKLANKQYVLIDATGTDTSISGSAGWSAWPDTTTATANPENGGSARKFRMSDRY
jgi:hypothetical protein